MVIMFALMVAFMQFLSVECLSVKVLVTSELKAYIHFLIKCYKCNSMSSECTEEHSGVLTECPSYSNKGCQIIEGLEISNMY